MLLPLRLHPDSRCAAVTQIGVDLVRPQAGRLVLSYVVTGAIDDLRIPPVAAPVRTDELWRHTCFEIFVRPSPGDAYYEFNFAPSTAWAAHRFGSYRSRMLPAAIDAPRIEVRSDPAHFTLHTALDLDRLLSPPGESTWRLGISAVIEQTDGNVSYWALAHPPGKADFHHSDCFACELPWRP
jgi:hypothetical protein